VAGESKADGVVRVLESTIRAEGLLSGDLIGTKRELAAQLKVSPGTLNEALRVMVSRGSIELRPGRSGGVFVGHSHKVVRLRNIVISAEGAQDKLADATAVRDQLEPLVAVEAARCCTDVQANRLRKQLAVIAALPKGREEILAVWELHRMIARIGGNRFLTDVYIEAVDTLEFVATSFDVAQRPAAGIASDTVGVHSAMVEAIAAHDAKLARAAALAHSPIPR
jgi:GntR family transcriptional regulator, transcriptional repressor for pyruvate dehydrogenase complex